MTDDSDAVDVLGWMSALIDRLRECFGARLLAAGLQGSHRRGEATPASDIDAVVVLDRVSVDDLRRYRDIVLALPHADKACGFIGGAGELRSWPRHELLQFINDTRLLHGEWGDLRPAFTADDARDAVRILASGLYHQAAHLYVHGGPGAVDDLKGAYKSAFFLLQALVFLERGEYPYTREALRRNVDGRELGILDRLAAWDAEAPARRADPDALFSELLEWSGSLLERYANHGDSQE